MTPFRRPFFPFSLNEKQINDFLKMNKTFDLFDFVGFRRISANFLNTLALKELELI